VATLTDVDLSWGTLNAGDVDRLRLVITKDGVPWDLTSGAVTLTFEKPDRATQFERAASAENAAGGVFYYDTTTTDFGTNDVGYWTATVKVVDGAVVKRYPHEIGFRVVNEP
jgi:hypothetical protein